MRKRRSTFILMAVFLTGLSLLLYPVVSSYVNERHETKAVASYQKSVSELSPQDYSDILRAAEEYNEALALSPTSFAVTEEQTAEYDKLLDPTGSGIMCSLEIPSIGVTLPVYHGVSDAVLEVGAGHVPGSSLPVGGGSTHAVMSGHRGLPSSRLFTDLDQLRQGDVFLLRVVGETLAYEVDQIRIVQPDDTSLLGITEGMDYCTLVTCTPYGVNTQRLLVRGVRVPYTKTMTDAADVQADAVAADPMLVASVLAVPALLILLLAVLRRTSPRNKKHGGEAG